MPGQTVPGEKPAGRFADPPATQDTPTHSLQLVLTEEGPSLAPGPTLPQFSLSQAGFFGGKQQK